MWVISIGILLSLSLVGSSLKTFTLRYSDNWPLHLDEYVKVIAENCQLTTLDITIFGGDPTSPPTMVQHLLLTGNRLSHLANFTFARSSQMKTIDVSNNEITTLMPQAFVGLGNLRTLDLSGNKIFRLVTSLLSELTSLENFLIRENMLVTVDLTLFANKVNMSLLDLGQNRIRELERTQNKSDKIYIRYVHLDQNDLMDVSMLRVAKKLEQLNTANNRNLEFSGFKEKYFPKLKDLSLAGTNLRKLGDNFRFFSTLSTLQTLNLMDNDLDQFPSEHLPELKRVYDLNIAKNRINYLDTDRLFQTFPNLRRITMSENNWDCINLRQWMKQIKDRNIDVSFNGSHRILGQENIVNGVGCLYKSDENSKNIKELKAALKGVKHRKELIIVVLAAMNVIQMIIICRNCCSRPTKSLSNESEPDVRQLGMTTYVRNELQAGFENV